MKLLSSITLTLLASTLTYAQTTMCFKENHNSMSTIESTKLDGGECKNTHTINEMKEKGWKVDDIKITTTNQGKYNFIYILKKGSTNTNFSATNSNISEEQLEKNILKRLEKKKEKEKKEKEIEKKLKDKIAGKEIYINKCQSCHGEKGEKSAYNASKPLKDMNLEDMSYSIDRYTLDASYGNGYQTVMRSIAANITKNDLEKIYNYLESLNK